MDGGGRHALANAPVESSPRHRQPFAVQVTSSTRCPPSTMALPIASSCAIAFRESAATRGARHASRQGSPDHHVQPRRHSENGGVIAIPVCPPCCARPCPTDNATRASEVERRGTRIGIVSVSHQPAYGSPRGCEMERPAVGGSFANFNGRLSPARNRRVRLRSSRGLHEDSMRNRACCRPASQHIVRWSAAPETSRSGAPR